MGSGLPLTGVELVAQNLSGFLSTLQQGNAAVGAFGKGMDEAGQHTTGSSQLMIGALRQVGVMAVDALAKATQAVIGFAKQSIDAASGFESGFTQFQIAVGHTIDNTGLKFDDFKKLFINLGKELPVSTQQVEEAAVEMARGGIDPATIAAGGLRQTINFAAAALKGDLTQAAIISAKTMQAWTGITDSAATKTDFLTHAQNLMTQATTAASTTVDQLFLGLSNMGGVARAAGVNFDQVVTSLAQLTPSFSSSAEAGNSLKMFIEKLNPTTKSAIAAMEGLGLYTEKTGSAFYDANGKFVGMQKTEQLLHDATKNLTDQQRIQIETTIFQQQGMQTAAVFARQGAEGYDAIAASIAKQTDLTTAAGEVQATYATAVENAKGSVEALQITVGTQLLPILTELMNNVVAPAINTLSTMASAVFGDKDAFDSLSPSLQGIVTGIKDFEASAVEAYNQATRIAKIFGEWYDGTINLKTALYGISTPLGDMTPQIEGVIKGIQDFGKILTDNKNIILGVATAIGSFSVISSIAGWITPAIGAITSFGAALFGAEAPLSAVVALLGGPVTLTIAGIALGIGVLTAAWTNNWGDIQGKTAEVWSYLKPIFDQALEWLQTNIPKAIKVAADYWTNTLWPALQKAGDFISTKVFPILKDLADLYLKAAGVEVKALGALWTGTLWPALQKVWSFIQDDVVPIFKALFDVEFAIAKKVVEALAGLWEKVLWPALQKAGSYINDTLLPVFHQIGDYLSATFGPTLKGIEDWLTKVTGGFDGVGSAVGKVTGFLEGLATKITTLKLPSWLTPGSPTPWEIALIGIGKALSADVAPGLATMQQGVQNIGKQISDTFNNTDLIGALKDLGLNAMEGFGAGLKSGLGAVKSIVTSTANTVEGAFRDALGAHSPATSYIPIGQSVTQGLMQGMIDVLPALLDVANQTAETMMAALTKHIEENQKKISAEFDAMVQSVKDITSQINAAIGDAFGSTASIDRQLADNLTKMQEVLPEYQKYTQGALDAAKQQALAFADPAEGAKYFKMRSSQIFEFAKLQKDLAATTDADEIARIQERMNLINAAQTAEISQFNAQMAGQTSPTQDITQKIQGLFSGSDLAGNMPGLLENAIIAQIQALMQQLASASAGNGSMSQTSTPMSGSQYSTYGGSISNSSQTSYNMPIYTNNSPAALQQSLALITAASTA